MDDLRRARFEEQQADVMEVEHVLTSPFRFLIGLAKWGLPLFFLAVWTVGVFAYKVIGGGDVMTRAAAARELIGRDGSVRTYILDLGQRSFTDRYSPDEGSGYYAPTPHSTRSGGCDRPQASACREDSVRPRHHRRCLPQRPLQQGSDDEQSNWSSWLSTTTSYRNDDLSPNITWFDSGNLTDGQQKAVDAMNQMSTDAFWLQAPHDNGIHDDATVLRFAANARFYRDHLMCGRKINPRTPE
jgi:hypothetical protein